MTPLGFGDALVHQVTELDSWTFPPHGLFPELTPEQLRQGREALPENYFDQTTGDLILAIRSHLIEIGGVRILVDPGNGNHKKRPELLAHHMFDTPYLDRLAAAGADPDSIDLVISTHLHPDHCGWGTTLNNGRWEPTFPRATYVFDQVELASLQQLAELAPTGGVQADLARTYADSVAPVLDSGSWKYAEDGQVIAEHGETQVIVRRAPGHTPGHIVVEIDHPGGGVVIAGDAIHHPLQLLNPALSQAGDSDPEQAHRTRIALLDRCAIRGLQLLAAHFRQLGPLTIQRSAAGYSTS